MMKKTTEADIVILNDFIKRACDDCASYNDIMDELESKYGLSFSEAWQVYQQLERAKKI
jgi:hypothetical protein